MRSNRTIAGVLPITAVAVMAAAAGLANASPHGQTKASQPVDVQQFVSEVVQNEIEQESSGPPVYWRYLEIDKQNGTMETFGVFETKDGMVKRLLAIDGEPLSPAQSRKEDARLQKILNHPSTAQQAATATSQDAEKERKLLALLPRAFLFQYDGKVGPFVRVMFWPNPQFHPQNREAQVFHHMQGFLLLAPDQKRLAEIDGRLMSEVKFMWGILGYLNKGGTFQVKQSNIRGSDWEMVRLYVNMQGKALFFKTVGVQENERFEDYQENPPEMTLRQAIDQLEKATPPKQAMIR